MYLSWDRAILWGFVLYGVWAFLSPASARRRVTPTFGDASADLVKPNRKSGRLGVAASNEETAGVLAASRAS